MPTIEIIPTTKPQSAAPGWAYVPVTAANDPSKAPILPTSTSRTGATKRAAARTAADILTGTHTKNQATKVRLRLEELAKDNAGRQDVGIPEALKKEIAEGRWKAGKGVTTNVRRVVASEKGWVHHVADVAAENEMGEGRKRREVVEVAEEDEDAEMLDAGNVEGLSKDEARLLQVDVPPALSKAVLNRLTRAPPLTYAMAAAGEASGGAPLRRFCDMCAYWGKMKCTLCGSYVCSLLCKQTHDASEHPHR